MATSDRVGGEIQSRAGGEYKCAQIVGIEFGAPLHGSRKNSTENASSSGRAAGYAIRPQARAASRGGGDRSVERMAASRACFAVFGRHRLRSGSRRDRSRGFAEGGSARGGTGAGRHFPQGELGLADR